MDFSVSPMSLLLRFRAKRCLRHARLVVCDVDGVLTDGKLHYDENGHVAKVFSVRDGLAVRMLQRSGVIVSFLSGGRSGAIEQRANHLDVKHCIVGAADKASSLSDLRARLNVPLQNTVFLGDDLNDLTVRPVVGSLVATRDAVPALRAQSDLVLQSCGGSGALRELAELILSSQGLLNTLHREGWRDVNS